MRIGLHSLSDMINETRTIRNRQVWGLVILPATRSHMSSPANPPSTLLSFENGAICKTVILAAEYMRRSTSTEHGGRYRLIAGRTCFSQYLCCSMASLCRWELSSQYRPYWLFIVMSRMSNRSSSPFVADALSPNSYHRCLAGISNSHHGILVCPVMSFVFVYVSAYKEIKHTHQKMPVNCVERTDQRRIILAFFGRTIWRRRSDSHHRIKSGRKGVNLAVNGLYGWKLSFLRILHTILKSLSFVIRKRLFLMYFESFFYKKLLTSWQQLNVILIPM